MTRLDTDTLERELEDFRQEKEKIRALVGQIGGKESARRDRVINVAFIILLGALLGMDILRHFLDFNISFLPPLFSLELGILMVSIKIIWMIHKQTKVEHFQFWILNSIEFRLTHLDRKISKIEKKLDQHETTVSEKKATPRIQS